MSHHCLVIVAGRRLRLPVVAAALALSLACALVVLHSTAGASDAARCRTFAAAGKARLADDQGSGRRIVVIGDSYSVGLGLRDPMRSWPSQLPGRVHVSGFSGSGFSAKASPCGRVSYADRAARALRTGARVSEAGGAGRSTLIVVEGGLNDWNQSAAAVRAGFGRLVTSLRGHPVLVVGPALAPSRARGARRIDLLLAELSARAGVDYLSMLTLDLPYLADRLHLTTTGHRLFGERVADAVAGLR